MGPLFARSCRLLFVALVINCVAVYGKYNSTPAGDWPQILGPTRNGIAQNEKLDSKWPQSGPKLIWQKDVGSGFAGIAVKGATAILFDRVRNEEVVQALSVTDGSTQWKKSFSTNYQPSFVNDDGPRCVPVIVGDRVILHGAGGQLTCLNLQSKKVIWSRDTHKDFGAPDGYFGAGSSPVVVDDKVVLNVGGARQQAGVVAFDLKTGETIWKSTDEAASYSSPIVATVDDVSHLIVSARLKTFSLDPSTGNVRFEIPFGKRGPTVNGASPVMVDDRLFLTASYRIGSVYAKVFAKRAEVVWENEEVMASQYTTPVSVGKYLIGIDGRQDGGPASLKCFDPQTRKVQWEESGFGYATLILADDKLLVMKTDGTLVMAAADTDEYKELGRARLMGGTTRSLPALSNGRFFVKNESELKCFQLGALAGSQN